MPINEVTSTNIYTSSSPVKRSLTQTNSVFQPQKNALQTNLLHKLTQSQIPSQLYVTDAIVTPDKYILKYANKNFIENAIKNNPKILELLQQEGVPLKIEPQNVTGIMRSHLIPTMEYAKMIMKNSGEYFTTNDYNQLIQASLLHDIGKALIPSEILNKQGVLTSKEREIVKLHNDLGYELLANTPLNKRILLTIQNHHGYGNNYPKDSMAQILTVADIYSALKENRPYKKPMSDDEAFKILEEGAKAGDYNINYVKTLKKCVNPTSNDFQIKVA